MESCQGFPQAFVVTSQAPEPIDPAETALHYPATRQQHKALLGLRQLYDVQCDAFLLRGFGRAFSCVASIDEGQFHRLACDMLNFVRQRSHLSALLLVGRRDLHYQQVAEGVYRHVHLNALLALVAVVASTRSAFAVGLQRSAFQDHSARLPLLALRDLHDRTQVANHCLEATSPQPPLDFLVDRLPRRKLKGNQAPGRPGSRHPAQCIEHQRPKARPSAYRKSTMTVPRRSMQPRRHTPSAMR